MTKEKMMRLKTCGWMGLVLAFAVASYANVPAEGLNVGDAAPAFEAKDQDGKPWKLEEHRGKFVVVYFYPAAMTGGCTKQACSYRDFVKEQGSDDIVIVGISGDEPGNLKHFQQANQLNFTLLSDPEGAVAKRYGVPVKVGKKSIKRTVGDEEVTLERTNTTARWTFIVDRQGKVVYKDAKVAAAEDRSKVIEFIRNLEQ
jgi:peroxiredoxin Q/BCP